MTELRLLEGADPEGARSASSSRTLPRLASRSTPISKQSQPLTPTGKPAGSNHKGA